MTEVMRKIIGFGVAVGILITGVMAFGSQSTLDGMLEVREGEPATLVIEGNAAKVLFSTIRGASKIIENAEDDCALQRIRTGTHISCGHCERGPDDSAANYWCTMQLDPTKGEFAIAH